MFENKKILNFNYLKLLLSKIIIDYNKILIFFTYYYYYYFVYCLEFYKCLGPESPLNERYIMEDRLSFSTGSMPQIWPGQSCS